MTERKLLNRVRKLKELEAQKKQLETEITAIQEELKAEMQIQEKEELQAGDHTIRWKTIITNRLDTNKLKASHEHLYNQYLKQSSSRRFSIA